MSILVLFYSFLKIFQIIQQFFDFDDFHFWSYGELGGTFEHLGNIFKKSVGDIIFYYDSTHKIRKNIFEGTFPPGHNYVNNYIRISSDKVTHLIWS